MERGDMQQLAIGKIFSYKGKKYKVTKGNLCEGCAFYDAPEEDDCVKLVHGKIPFCSPLIRDDKTDVVFIEVEGA